MPEREGWYFSPDDKGGGGGAKEFTLPNEDGLRELGFSDYEIAGGRALEKRRRDFVRTVGAPEDLESLASWHRMGRSDSAVRRFQMLFEQLAAWRTIGSPRAREQAAAFLTRALSVREEQGAAGEFLYDLGHQGLGDLPPSSAAAAGVIQSLVAPEVIQDREVTALEALTSPSANWRTRLAWLKMRFDPALKAVRYIDSKQKEPQKPLLDQPPPDSETGHHPPQKHDEHVPTMEARKQGQEGEAAQPDYIVSPAAAGYFETESFGRWDGRRWTKSATKEHKYDGRTNKGGPVRTVTVIGVEEGFSPVPLLPNQRVTNESISSARRRGFKIFADATGHIYVAAPAGQAGVDCQLEVAEGEPRRYKSRGDISIQTPSLTGVAPQVIEELNRLQAIGLDPINRAATWGEFVQEFLTYSNDEKWNDIYGQAPAGWFAAVSKGRMADCDVAQTFFLEGCACLSVQGEMAAGYHVVKTGGGDTKLMPSDLHAWSKVFDPATGEMTRMDFTPPDQSEDRQDQNQLDEGQSDKDSQEKEKDKKGGSEDEGGEGEQDALDGMEQDVPTEAEIADIGRKMAQNQEKARVAAEKRAKIKEFAQDANCTEAEAAQVLTEIEQALEIEGEDHGRIIDRLVRQFMRIVQERTLPQSFSMPSVPMSEGVELTEPVEAMISLRAGSLDPLGFAREAEIQTKMRYYGGFRLVIINDGSSSMNQPITKLTEQRKMNFLILEALDRMRTIVAQRQATMLMPLDIETQVEIFHGHPHDLDKGDVIIAKPLSTGLTSRDKYNVWQALSRTAGGTIDHLALKWLYESLTPEDKQRLQSRKLLMVVIVNADGESNRPNEVQQWLMKLRDMNIIVKGRGITKEAQQMAETYAPDGSWGEVAEYPDFLADTVIPAIKQLAPKWIGIVR